MVREGQLILQVVQHVGIDVRDETAVDRRSDEHPCYRFCRGPGVSQPVNSLPVEVALVSDFPLSRDDYTGGGFELSGLDRLLHLAEPFSRNANRIRGSNRQTVIVGGLADNLSDDEEQDHR